MLAVSVKVLEVVLLAGLKDAVTPLGKADVEKLITSVKPFIGLAVIVLVPPMPPCVMVKLVGEEERLKSGLVVVGQLLTRLAALIVPIPVAKSQPVWVLNAISSEVLEVDNTP